MSSEALTGANWIVYVDGLNFYAAVRGRPDTKWVDFRALADRLVPRAGTVSKVSWTKPIRSELLAHQMPVSAGVISHA